MNNGRSRERGQALVMVTLALFVLMGMLGLVVDLGWAYFTKQSAQSAVDAAALAAVQVAANMGETTSASYTCPSTTSSSTNLQVGCYYASQNGFTVGGSQNVIMSAGTGNATILDLSSTAYPTYTVNTSYWVTARATQSLPQLFSAIMPGHGSMLSSARATAASVSVALNACAYLLGNTPGATDLNLTGPDITASNCGIYVDANASTVGGDINIANLNVSGAFSNTGTNMHSTVVTQNSSTDYPDPLAAAAPPTVGTCSGNATDSIVGPGTYTLNGGTYCGGISITSGSANVTFNPGTYAGGISITGNATVTFQPGTYVLAGGLNVTGGNLTGTGVTFYSTAVGSDPIGPINMTGGTVTFSAPTTGSLEGMLFFENRSASEPDQITGTNYNMTGNLYFSGSALQYVGASSSDVAIVSKSLTMVGGTLSQPSLPAAGGPSAPKITLIE